MLIAKPKKEKTMNNQRILLVDDSDFFCRFLRRLLHGGRFTVEEVYSCEKANDNFDLIITEIRMPFGKDGFEAYKEILASKPEQKFLFCVTTDSDKRLSEVDHVLLKHEAIDDLLPMVYQILNGKPTQL